MKTVGVPATNRPATHRTNPESTHSYPPPMTSEESQPAQEVFDALADPDCRRIVVALEEPMTAKEVAEALDLPQTSTYRKLELLSDAGFVEDRTRVRTDGHHATCYVRDMDGVFVAVEGDQSFDVTVVSESESPDERLARFWSRISEEL